MCIVTIRLPLQNQENDRPCIFMALYRSCNGNNTHDCRLSWLLTGSIMITMHIAAHCPGFVQVVHVHCYHYTTCTKPGQWAVMRIVTITLPVQSQENKRSCVFRSFTWLCTGSVMVTIHMTAYLPGFVQVV
jgi:hypothetical protein